jgi:hypothetical protein
VVFLSTLKKGNDHLTVTWKVNDHCFQHIDVLEEKKLNSFSVGKRLIIDGEDFEDLDEILARLVNPMAQYVREIMSHKNFNTFSSSQDYNQTQDASTNATATALANNTNTQVNKLESIEQYLVEERTKAPSKIPYVFTCCRQLPGKFMLSYMIKLKLRNEYITITHEGFKFRQKLFRTFNELVAWFKLHFNDPLPVVMPPPPPPLPTQSQPPLPPPSPSRRSGGSNHRDLMSQMSSMSVDSRATNKPPSQQQNLSDVSYSNSHSEMHNQTHSYSTADHSMSNNDEDWDSVAFGGGGGNSSSSRVNSTQMDTSYRSSTSVGGRDFSARGGGNRGASSRGGMERRGGGGVGGDRKCYKCGEPGHMSRECPNPGSNAGGGGGGYRGGDNDRKCFKCGETGHMSRECPNPGNSAGSGGYRGGGGDNKCFKCGEPGHISRDCPSAAMSGGGRGGGRGGGYERGRGGAGRDSNYTRPNYNKNGSGLASSTVNANDDDWDVPSANSSTMTNNFRSVATPQHVPSAAQTPKPVEDWDDDAPPPQPQPPRRPPVPSSTTTTAAPTPPAPARQSRFSAAKTPSHTNEWDQAPPQPTSTTSNANTEDWDAEPAARSYSSARTPQYTPNTTTTNNNNKTPSTNENRSYNSVRTPQYTPNESRSYNAARTPQHSSNYTNNNYSNSASKSTVNANDEDWDADASATSTAQPPPQPPPQAQNNFSYKAARTPQYAPNNESNQQRSYNSVRTPQHSSFSNSRANEEEEDWDANPAPPPSTVTNKAPVYQAPPPKQAQPPPKSTVPPDEEMWD